MKTWISIGSLTAVLLVASLAWWFWPRTNPQLAKVDALRKEMTEMMAQGPDINPQKGRELFEKMGKEIEKLPEEDRQKVMADGMSDMQRMMERQFRRYFEAAPEEQVKILDEDIDRMNRFMAMGPPPGGRPREGAQGGNATNGDGGPRPGGGPGPWGRGGTPEERNARRRGMLDHTTPEFRAQASAYFSAMMERRRERGLPEFPMPFGRR